jgi:hypothetical protein
MIFFWDVIAIFGYIFEFIGFWISGYTPPRPKAEVPFRETSSVFRMAFKEGFLV